ncbi:reverse transcriptase domain-containing protein [Tanacetum coccineum]|uniref:Reverse transcriptase domain-containing protein n=1 Tax=Tanacetum coccineum TaxID=301880 RepID=A0ABQ5HKT2_9ASTR
MEKLVEKLGNTEDKVECKKLKKEFEEERFSNTFLHMQNERVERDLYWTRVRAHEFYQEMIRRGFVFEERLNEAIDVPVEYEKSPLFELRGSPAAIRRMIKESVDAAIAAKRDSHANAGNDARGSGLVREAVELQRWFAKTKSFFRISEWAKGKKVKFAAATLFELWNLKVKEYNIIAYTQRFNELALMCPRMVEPESVKVDAITTHNFHHLDHKEVLEPVEALFDLEKLAKKNPLLTRNRWLLWLFQTLSYKKGLALVEEQLVFYKKNEEKESNLLKINNYDNATKNLDKVIGSQLVDNNKKGLGYNVVPPLLTGLFAPPTIDLSHSGIEKFKEPKFVGYGVKVDKIVSENSSVEIKKTTDAPIVEDWESDSDDEDDKPKPKVVKKTVDSKTVKQDVVSDGKLKKKTVFPTTAKIEVVKPKQQEKPVRKPVNDFVMNNKACFACGSFNHLIKDCKRKVQKPIWNNARRVNHHNSHRMSYPHPKRNFVPKAVLMKTRMRPVNAAKPKAAYNAVKRNRFNVVKASACWVWMPKNRVVDHVSKNISASVTLKRLDYIDAQGRFKSVMAWVPIRR